MTKCDFCENEAVHVVEADLGMGNSCFPECENHKNQFKYYHKIMNHKILEYKQLENTLRRSRP